MWGWGGGEFSSLSGSFGYKLKREKEDNGKRQNNFFKMIIIDFHWLFLKGKFLNRIKEMDWKLT